MDQLSIDQFGDRLDLTTDAVATFVSDMLTEDLADVTDAERLMLAVASLSIVLSRLINNVEETHPEVAESLRANAVSQLHNVHTQTQ